MVLSAADYLDEETVLSKLPFISVDEVADILLRMREDSEDRFAEEDEDFFGDLEEEEDAGLEEEQTADTAGIESLISQLEGIIGGI